jgi:hypothetical protein
MSQAGFLVQPGQAEVDDDRLAVALHHHVRRREVAVHDPLTVYLLQGAGELGDDLGGAALRHRVAGTQFLGERLALDVGHRQVGAAVLLAHIVDRADVGVVKLGGGPHLAEEALAQGRAVGGPEVRELHRHLAPHPGVLRQVDRAHRPAAQLLEEVVTVAWLLLAVRHGRTCRGRDTRHRRIGRPGAPVHGDMRTRGNWPGKRKGRRPAWERRRPGEPASHLANYLARPGRQGQQGRWDCARRRGGRQGPQGRGPFYAPGQSQPATCQWQSARERGQRGQRGCKSPSLLLQQADL